MTIFGSHIIKVIQERSEKEMVRINAPSIITAMQHKKALPRAFVDFVRNTVGFLITAIHRNLTITVTIQ